MREVFKTPKFALLRNCMKWVAKFEVVLPLIFLLRVREISPHIRFLKSRHEQSRLHWNVADSTPFNWFLHGFLGFYEICSQMLPHTVFWNPEKSRVSLYVASLQPMQRLIQDRQATVLTGTQVSNSKPSTFEHLSQVCFPFRYEYSQHLHSQESTTHIKGWEITTGFGLRSQDVEEKPPFFFRNQGLACTNLK